MMNNLNQITNKQFIIFILIVFLVILVALPFSVYGQDGYSIWYPVLAEYLNGDKVYHSSAVIFNGKNLSAIYGELPFWKLFRLIQLPNPYFLNLTHYFFVTHLFVLFLITHKELKKNLSKFDIFFLILLAGFTPTVLNRVWAGHMNLLFGVLPFFGCLALIFNQSKKTVILCFLSFWFALSTCVYQILAYYIFYIPLLLVIYQIYCNSKIKTALLTIGLLGIAFFVNISQFIEMYQHAMDANNARSLSENVVYSYLTSNLPDLLQFFFSGMDSLFGFRNLGLYHEVNFGMGLFIIIFTIFEKNKKIVITTALTFLVMYLFCMNIFPFNVFSHFPVLKAFRVPQRCFMMFGLFLPFWAYCKCDPVTDKKMIGLFITLMALAQIVPSFEIIAIIGILCLLALNENAQFENHRSKIKNGILILGFSTLFVGMTGKILQSQNFQYQFDLVTKTLQPLKERFTKEELRQYTFHFETPFNQPINYVAHANGIRTIEGYGHPPKDLLLLLSQLTGQAFVTTSNSLFFPFNSPNKYQIYKAFGVDYEITLSENLSLEIKEIKD